MVNAEKPTDDRTECRGGLVLLHGARSNVAAFEAFVAEKAPQLARRHVVAADLLARAERTGLDDTLRRDLRDTLQDIAEGQPRLVLCTCTTLGGLAEELGPELGLCVHRIDRALAEAALEAGRRILVLATAPTTLEPTANLINAVAAELAMRPEVRVHLVEGAWPLFRDGDLEGYYRVIAAAAREMAGEADVLVLAQASMAPAKAQIGELTASVLTSPEPGMARALALLCGPPT